MTIIDYVNDEKDLMDVKEKENNEMQMRFVKKNEADEKKRKQQERKLEHTKLINSYRNKWPPKLYGWFNILVVMLLAFI